MPHPCCFCDAPIDARFDFCKACKELFDSELGPGWEHADWFKATAKLSRRADYLDRKELPFSALAPGELAAAQPIPPAAADAPISAAALDDLITQALAHAPGTGWRRMHKLMQEQGIATTARRVRCALERIRKARAGE